MRKRTGGDAELEYFADMLGQLSGDAKRRGFLLLAYLLAMAQIETERASRNKKARN